MKTTIYYGMMFLAFLCAAKHSFSQGNNLTDSLEHLLSLSKEDTLKTGLLIDLSKAHYLGGDYDRSLQYAEQAKALSERLEYDKGLSSALINIAFVHFGRAEYKKALGMCEEALKIRIRMKDQPGIAKVENTIGAIYTNMGKYPEALVHCLNALKIIEKTNDSATLASIHGSIGNIYMFQRNTKKALESYMKSYSLFSKTNQKNDISRALNAIGNCYDEMGDYPKALEYYTKSLKIKEEIGSKVGIATAHSNIGLMNSHIKNYNEAVPHLNKAFSIHEQLGNKLGMAITLSTLAEVFMKQKKYEEALVYANRSLALSTEIGSMDEIKETEKVLSEIYEAKGDHANALVHYRLFINARDSVHNEANSKVIAELQVQYETEKKENENKTLLQENLIQSIEINRNRTYVIALAGILILVLSFAFLIIRQNRLRARQKSLILEQKLLRSQMNPHFIFNSLIAIESYIYKNEPKEAGRYLSGFARLMRLILENSREEYITLSKEIKTLEYYLDLQKNRFDDTFDYTIRLSENTDPDTIAIPPMLAQPFIENSIEHGLKNINRKGRIDISFHLAGDELLFEVRDNGIGIEKSMALNENNRKHRSMATTITMERLAIMNRRQKKKIRMMIEEQKDTSGEVSGTCISFAIPYREI